MADVEDAWLFFHMLFELIWAYRFLYRDLNDLLSNNRKLETHFQFVLQRKTRAVQAVLSASAAAPGSLQGRDAEPVACDGGGAHLLAELRIREEPAQGARAKERRAGACCAAPSTYPDPPGSYLDEDGRQHLRPRRRYLAPN